MSAWSINTIFTQCLIFSSQGQIRPKNLPIGIQSLLQIKKNTCKNTALKVKYYDKAGCFRFSLDCPLKPPSSFYQLIFINHQDLHDLIERSQRGKFIHYIRYYTLN